MSNNGSQHLSALTKDEITAPHVNLVPLDLPGDLYRYVADHIWEHLDKVVASMPKQHVKACESFIDNLIEFKKKIGQAEPRSETRLKLVDEIRKFKDSYPELMNDSSAVYWARVKDYKQRRKIVKRNVMTLPYGGTAYGLG